MSISVMQKVKAKKGLKLYTIGSISWTDFLL